MAKPYSNELFWSSFGGRRQFFAIDMTYASVVDNILIFLIDGRGVGVVALHAIFKGS